MQVTTEGERIVRLLAEVISAKGFERDSIFESAKNIIDGLPKLEGTVHVNRALALKFMPQYLFGSNAELDAPPVRRDPGDVAVFREQADALVALVQEAPLTQDQMRNDLDFQQSLAQLFTLIPYAQLVLEQARVEGTPDDLVDSIFATFVRDFSATAVELHGKAS